MSAYHEIHIVSSSPFPVTNDYDNGKLHLFIVTFATGTINLPGATGFGNSLLCFKKRNANAGTIALQPEGTNKINGASPYALTSDHQFVKILSDGTDWHIVANG